MAGSGCAPARSDAGITLGRIWPAKPYDAYRERSFEALTDRWFPLTLAMNSLARSLGHPDLYPFAIPPPAYAKLKLAHELVREVGQ